MVDLALVNKAIQLHQQGNYRQAEKKYLQLLKKEKNDPQLNYLLGLLYGQTGNTVKAEVYLSRAVKLGPGNDTYLVDLGFSQLHNKNYEAALLNTEKAIDLNPGNPFAWHNRGLALAALDREIDAMAAYVKALELEPGHIDSIQSLANIYERTGHASVANEMYQKILSLNENYVDALKWLAKWCLQHNDKPQAVSLYRRVLTIDPYQGEAWFLLAQSVDASERAGLKQKLDMLNPQQFQEKSRLYVFFARAYLSDKAGDHEKAFDNYHVGNRIKRKTYPYKIDSQKRFYTQLQQTYTRDYIAQSSVEEGKYQGVPVFIVGMPRSGTTLLERMLATHSSVAGAGELVLLNEVVCGKSDITRGECEHAGDYWTEEKLHQARAVYLEKRNQREDIGPLIDNVRYVTDKLPENFVHLGFIKCAFPEAKILHISRNPVDNCISLYTQVFAGQIRYAYDMKELANAYANYRELIEFWDTVIPDIHHVRYEDLVSEPESSLRNILKYLQLPWEDACLEFHKQKTSIRTASWMQATKPVYRDSVGRWKKYQDYIQPMLSELERLGVIDGAGRH